VQPAWWEGEKVGLEVRGSSNNKHPPCKGMLRKALRAVKVESSGRAVGAQAALARMERPDLLGFSTNSSPDR
jgi:hypothetical protein